MKMEYTALDPLDKRTKWTYCIGATGRDMAYTLVSMFLISYIQYTMNLTVAQYSVISAIIIVCLLWDAFNDPLMGIIIENSKLKLGKYRPWILIGCLLNAVVIICLFSIRPTGWGFVAFFGIGYLLWGMTYTMNDISYWGMLPSLSSNPKDRSTLVTLMAIFVCVGQFSVAGLLPVIVAGNAVNTYRICALVIALCFVAFQTLTVIGVRERKPVAGTQERALSLKDMFKILFRNDQLVTMGISSLLFNIGNGLLIMFGMNFFYFEFGYSDGGTLVFLFTVMYGLGTLLSQVVFPFITARFKRKQILTFISAAILICYLLFLSYGYIIPKNAIILNIIGFLIFFFQGFMNLLIIIMLNNTIEYDEYKHKERHDSIISAVRSFTVKLASAINQGILALVLIISGIYALSQKVSALEILAGKGSLSSDQVREQADSIIAQASDSQLLILRIGMVIVPIVAISICYTVIRKKYIIDEEMYSKLVKEIAADKPNASTPA